MQETDTLRRLHESGGHPCIPKLLHAGIGIVGFRRQCENSEVSSLALSGIVGIAASNVVLFSIEQLTKLFKGVKAALIHAHSRSCCHLDVRPSNIIVALGPEDTTLKVQLVDWGCAQFISDSKVKGFWGSVPFAHDEIQFKTSQDLWIPKTGYDFASLAFTMAALLGHVSNEMPWPWPAFFMRVDQDMLDSRRIAAVAEIDGSDLNEELKAELKRYLPPKFGPPEPAADSSSNAQEEPTTVTAPTEQAQAEPATESNIADEEQTNVRAAFPEEMPRENEPITQTMPLPPDEPIQATDLAGQPSKRQKTRKQPSRTCKR
jgi:serine/threonine protein kinase